MAFDVSISGWVYIAFIYWKDNLSNMQPSSLRLARYPVKRCAEIPLLKLRSIPQSAHWDTFTLIIYSTKSGSIVNIGIVYVLLNVTVFIVEN